MVLEADLTDLGHEVTLARDGQHALDLWEAEGPFDALVTDMQMPRMRGDELVRRLRAEQPNLPVLILSANYPPDKGDALALLGGPLSIQTKPIHFGHFADEFNRLIGPGST